MCAGQTLNHEPHACNNIIHREFVRTVLCRHVEYMVRGNLEAEPGRREAHRTSGPGSPEGNG